MESIKTIFIIDDNEIDCMVAKILIEKVNPLYRVYTFFEPASFFKKIPIASVPALFVGTAKSQ